MKVLHVVGCVVVALVLCLCSDQVQGGKDKDLVVGKVKTVNAEKSYFTIALESGKERKFSVDKTTKFVGPKGGVSADGLKDDRMVKGNEVKVMPSKDGKTASEVRLPVRTKDKK